MIASRSTEGSSRVSNYQPNGGWPEQPPARGGQPGQNGGQGQYGGQQGGYGRQQRQQPPYGQYPGYGQGYQPPGPEPGGIPLRPLGVGEILSGAFTSIRQNPAATLGLSAVLEETNGRKSYWALVHRPGQPDFHHSDCFTLEFS